MSKLPKYLVYDIETIPESEAAPLWLEKRNGDEDEFPPIAAHKIVSIGILTMNADYELLDARTLGARPAHEESILYEFCAQFDKEGPTPRLVDWNGRHFDMPVIQTRCFHYGWSLPWYFAKQPDNYGKTTAWSKEYRDRYGGRQIDLVDQWTNMGAARKPHLAELAVLMGLPGKTDLDGSMVYDTYKAGKYVEIDRYCMQDVYQTALVFLRFLHIRGNIPRGVLRSSSELILEHAQKADPAFHDKVNLDRVLLRMASRV